MERHRKLITPSLAALSRWLCSPCFVFWLFSDDILRDTKVNQRLDLACFFGFFYLWKWQIFLFYKGTYFTHEAKGADDAADADTAIINAEGGHNNSDDKKEYYI